MARITELRCQKPGDKNYCQAFPPRSLLGPDVVCGGLSHGHPHEMGTVPEVKGATVLESKFIFSFLGVTYCTFRNMSVSDILGLDSN